MDNYLWLYRNLYVCVYVCVCASVGLNLQVCTYFSSRWCIVRFNMFVHGLRCCIQNNHRANGILVDFTAQGESKREKAIRVIQKERTFGTFATSNTIISGGDQNAEHILVHPNCQYSFVCIKRRECRTVDGMCASFWWKGQPEQHIKCWLIIDIFPSTHVHCVDCSLYRHTTRVHARERKRDIARDWLYTMYTYWIKIWSTQDTNTFTLRCGHFAWATVRNLLCMFV